jgi:fibronectin type 3 domain-containing protein
LYEPFFGSQTALQPYLNFYQGLAQGVHALGMKLLVENNVLLSTGTEAGWTNVGAYYATLTWAEFIAARATMAGTVAQYMQPDYLMLSEEPDNEAANTGQTNLNIPLDAAAMIAGEITAARAVSPTMTLGAGFGTWLAPSGTSSLTAYLAAYVALPMNYIDMHIYPINTEYNGAANLLNNALIVASGAAAAGMPVAISESWPWKMENAEFNVDSPNEFRSRDPFSFWAPIDTYFIQTMESLADYTQMLYLTSQGNDYFLAYQTYGGTAANGGAANCTCTTATCSESDITSNANNLADSAGQIANFTSTGFAYNALLVAPPDTIAPAAPSNLVGTAGYNSASLTWSAASDNIGVAGYNVYRCTPSPCTGAWIANTATMTYFDDTLTDDTSYQYQVQAFDFANNTSPMSNTLNLTTENNTPPNAPTNTAAKATSPKQITLTWSAPPNAAGLGEYKIYAGSSPASLVQIAVMPSTSTTYQNMNLLAATTYYYGVVAMEDNMPSPMSPVVSATTLPLPNSPTTVVATPASPTKITLTWKEMLQPGGLAIANYQVYQSTGGAFTKIATTTTTTYNNMSLAPNTTYSYQIVAVDSALDDSAPSNPISSTTMPMPPAPANLNPGTVAATKFTLTWQWTAAPGGLPISRFYIYCGTTPAGQPQVGTALNETYTYTSAIAATTYYCYVEAVDTGNDDSPPSANLVITTAPMPNAPTNVVATANGDTKVTVTWTETVPQGGLPVANYKIYRSTTLPVTTANYVATRTTLSYIDTTVLAGKTYYYAISAIDSSQDASPLSATATVTTP